MGDRTTGLAVHLQQAGPIPLDAELSCAPGELLALVGPSGSGKSTILRTIAGLNRVRHGRIAVAGQVWFDSCSNVHLSPQRRRVGLVFQQYALFPHLDAQTNVALALGHLPAARRTARAKELLEAVHLSGLEHRTPGELSGGQQQRVALARALARDPIVLLLDEPFSAVDQVTRRKLQRELAQLRQALAIPIVLVTHDLEEAGALADRLTILHQGRTLQSGAPPEVMARPANALVARLVDLRNLHQGEVVGHDPEAGHTFVRWRNRVLEARLHSTFTVGEEVDWTIPAASVILHRRDRPSRGERENPVDAVIGELLALGEITSMTLFVDGRNDCTLSLSVPTHVAKRNGLAAGETVRVSLLAEALHLMAKAERRATIS